MLINCVAYHDGLKLADITTEEIISGYLGKIAAAGISSTSVSVANARPGYKRLFPVNPHG